MSKVEVIDETAGPPDLFLTCEHGGNALPDWIDPLEHEREWIEAHWGWDPGADQLVERLCELEEGYAVLARYSRLMCDPNRSRQQQDLVRTHVFDEPISFNEGLTEAEVDQRFADYHEPYHDEVDRHLERQTARNPDLFLVSIHTFTPELDGDVRDMEIGVLFDDAQPYADRVAESIREEGFDTALNAPYSGYNDLIYSVKRHGTEHDVHHVELEIRNDLLETSDEVERIAQGLSTAINRLSWYGE